MNVRERLAIKGGNPVRTKTLGYGHQCIAEDDVAAVVATLNSEYLTCGPMTNLFEERLKEVTRAKSVTAVSNGTAALHVACLAAGIGEGDEVVVSPITFAASANCILYCGGTPVFADIDPKTWNIDPEAVRDVITQKTRAIIAVDFAGVPANLNVLKRIADEHHLILIEDAAHSLGSCYRGHPIGSIADMTTFSFHPVKTITTGEGGAISTNDLELAKRIALYSKHGITRDSSLFEHESQGGWYYEQIELGFNYRIDDISAALGVSQLAKLEQFAERRKRIVSLYDEAFSNMEYVSFQEDVDPDETVRHLYVLKFDVDGLGTTRRFIFDALRAEGIGVNVHYIPVYQLPYYQRLGYGQRCCPNAENYYERAITLPLHAGMTDDDVANVVDAVAKVIHWCTESYL